MSPCNRCARALANREPDTNTQTQTPRSQLNQPTQRECRRARASSASEMHWMMVIWRTTPCPPCVFCVCPLGLSLGLVHFSRRRRMREHVHTLAQYTILLSTVESQNCGHGACVVNRFAMPFSAAVARVRDRYQIGSVAVRECWGPTNATPHA